MVLKFNSDDVSTFLSTAFRWIKEKCLWIWSYVAAVWAVLTNIRFLIRTITAMLIISGVCLLTVAIVGLVLFNKYFIFIGETFYLISGFLIVTALVLLLTTGLGCFAVKRKRYDFAVAYITLLVVVLIVETAITTAGFFLAFNSYFWKYNGIVHYTMQDSMQEFIKYGRNAQLWNNMQQEMRCCGVLDRRDYGNKLPISCCYYPETRFSPFVCTEENVFYQGCSDTLSYMLGDYMFAVGVTAASATGAQVIATFIAAFIAYRVKKNRQEIAYSGLLESQMDQDSATNYNTFLGVNNSGSDLLD